MKAWDNFIKRYFQKLTFDLSTAQVTALGQESNQLQEAHPDSADEIAAKQDEIVTAWGNLKDKVWYIDLMKLFLGLCFYLESAHWKCLSA